MPIEKTLDMDGYVDCPICRAQGLSPLLARNMLAHARKEVHKDIPLEEFPFPPGTAENCARCGEWYYPGPGGGCPTPGCPGTQPGDRATYREPRYKPTQDAMYGPRAILSHFESNRGRH